MRSPSLKLLTVPAGTRYFPRDFARPLSGVFDGVRRGGFAADGLPSLALSRRLLVPIDALNYGIVWAVQGLNL